MRNYAIALMLESTGEWEIIEEFEACDDDAANEYAKANYPGDEWYVLDMDNDMQNING